MIGAIKLLYGQEQYIEVKSCSYYRNISELERYISQCISGEKMVYVNGIKGDTYVNPRFVVQIFSPESLQQYNGS